MEREQPTQHSRSPGSKPDPELGSTSAGFAHAESPFSDPVHTEIPPVVGGLEPQKGPEPGIGDILFEGRSGLPPPDFDHWLEDGYPVTGGEQEKNTNRGEDKELQEQGPPKPIMPPEYEQNPPKSRKLENVRPKRRLGWYGVYDGPPLPPKGPKRKSY